MTVSFVFARTQEFLNSAQQRDSDPNHSKMAVLYYTFGNQRKISTGMLNLCRIAASEGNTPNVTPEFQPEISGASPLPPNLRRIACSQSASTYGLTHAPLRRGAKHGRKRKSGKQVSRYSQNLQTFEQRLS